MKNEKPQGEANRFYNKTGVAKHREWRGVKDTLYDYSAWLKNVAVLAGFGAKSPVRTTKAMFHYRWMGSYLGGLQLIDKITAGQRGPALRVSHTYMNAVFKASTDLLAKTIASDERFGETEKADKIVLLEQTMPPEIIGGFKNLQPMPLEVFQCLIGCFMDQHNTPYYLDIMESYGLPTDSCRLSASSVGVAINDEFPKNGCCIVINNMPCDSSTMNSQLSSRRLDIPEMVATMPMRWDEPDTMKYAVKQLRNVIKFVEESSGEKYDWSELYKIIDNYNEETQAELDKWDFMSTANIALGGATQSMYRAVYWSFSGGRYDFIRKADKKVLKIMEQAHKNNINCFPKTRYRLICWGAPASYYVTFPEWMYNCWGVHQVMNMDSLVGCDLISTESEEKVLEGIAGLTERSVMRRHLTGGYKHFLEVFEVAEQFDADIILVYDDITCKGALGMTGMLKDIAKTKRQKLVFVSHDLFDHRTAPRNQMRKQFNEFMYTVMNSEPLDKSLLDFDDSESWN